MDKSIRPKAVIFSQGDEVITGSIVDTNAAVLADHCRTLGFDVVRHITVADELDELVTVLQEIDALADICLCTGGLGPTQDDLTVEAFAKAFSQDLVFDDEALRMMTEYFAKMNAEMAAVNRKQAFLPENASRIDNHWGTAPGFIGQGKVCRFYCMPGVPYEMNQMMQATVLADMQSHFEIDAPTLVTFRILGMGESSIQQVIDGVDIADDIRVSFRAGLPEIELKLLFPISYDGALIRHWVDEIDAVLGHCVFAIDGLGRSVKNIADCVDQLMAEKQMSLNLLETLSKGDISRQCNADWLIRSIIYPYPDDILLQYKTQQKTLNESLAIEIAQQEHTNTDAAISLVQLFDRTDDNKVTIYLAIAGEPYQRSMSQVIKGRGQRQQLIASATTFNFLRKYLLDL
ncbi:competence/damage-inducible protein A [Cycloclasticus sp. 46_120_T64]|nr:competence/damage-inducible protein A [Cycloclasticus sp. 46_120_T64]